MAQLQRFERALPDLEALDAQVLGVSCDSAATHRAFAAHCGVHYPILSDWEPKGAVCRAYGVYDAEHGVPVRSAFVIDRDGVVRYAKTYPRGSLPDPAEIRETLRSL